MTTARIFEPRNHTMVKDADGDEFVVWYCNELREWRAEQWNGIGKNYQCIPALLHAKSEQELLADVRSHRGAA